MPENVDLKTSLDRIDAGQEAGDIYTGDLENIRDNLDRDDASGTTLGTMVSSQLQLTEAETRFQIRSGLPTKVTKAVKSAADGVKQAAS